jgi:steroid 5-alpha reductase family enzyme
VSTAGLLAVEAGLVLALVTVLWAVSVAVHDTSIVDIFWGSGFVVIAWVGIVLADGSRDRQLLLAVLVTAWGLRLTVHLARRNLGKGEDRRYAAMRRRHGDSWPMRSLVVVFLLQGALMWVVSLPVQVAMTDPTPAGLGPLDWVGTAVWAVGLAFETVGDLQLARFKADPANRGKVMDRGLWRYTRHPNYFGDFCVWWGIWLVALATGSAWWTVVGPAVMSVLLTRVSGAALLERSLSQRFTGGTGLDTGSAQRLDLRTVAQSGEEVRVRSESGDDPPSGPECRAEFDDDIDQSARPKRAAHPVHAARKLPPRPRHETSVEHGAGVGVHRAIGQSGDEPPACRDE